ncbi:MAG: hypothetical protein AAGB46_01195 [Verrucomicrobiota bacterium]
MGESRGVANSEWEMGMYEGAWVSLSESILENAKGKQVNSAVSSVFYELRNVKDSEVKATCGFSIYDGVNGKLIDSAEFTSVYKEKYR